jgi:hypothetical protein
MSGKYLGNSHGNWLCYYLVTYSQIISYAAAHTELASKGPPALFIS